MYSPLTPTATVPPSRFQQQGRQHRDRAQAAIRGQPALDAAAAREGTSMECDTSIALTETDADGVNSHSGAGAHDRGKTVPTIASLDAPIGGRDARE